MSDRDKLLKKARQSPRNMRFGELCKLAECFGWEFKRQNGTSHRIYVHPELQPAHGRRMNFQEGRDGKAKDYQIAQLLDAIDSLDNSKK